MKYLPVATLAAALAAAGCSHCGAHGGAAEPMETRTFALPRIVTCRPPTGSMEAEEGERRRTGHKPIKAVEDECAVQMRESERSWMGYFALWQVSWPE